MYDAHTSQLPCQTLWSLCLLTPNQARSSRSQVLPALCVPSTARLSAPLPSCPVPSTSTRDLPSLLLQLLRQGQPEREDSSSAGHSNLFAFLFLITTYKKGKATAGSKAIQMQTKARRGPRASFVTPAQRFKLPFKHTAATSQKL